MPPTNDKHLEDEPQDADVDVKDDDEEDAAEEPVARNEANDEDVEEEEDEDFEEGYFRARLPDIKNKEMFGIADQLVGGSRIKVNCEDGRSRLGRIPGKMKRRMWIRTGDLLIIRPWDFQADKCDIKYRYMRTQAVNMSKRKMIPESIDIF